MEELDGLHPCCTLDPKTIDSFYEPCIVFTRLVLFLL